MQTFFKILALSFVVGLIVAVAGIDPADLWRDLAGTVREIWSLFWDIGEEAVRYVILGAIIVVPIWLIVVALQRATARRNAD
jgi:Mn2+/Fe2+ NRAMP family transporter